MAPENPRSSSCWAVAENGDAGRIPPGTQRGSGLYFAQDQYKALDPAARLIDDLASIAPTAVSRSDAFCARCSAAFFFRMTMYSSGIGVLFRRRTQPLRDGPALLLQPPNFLLLDEPTNHLDLQAQGCAA